MDPKFEYTVEYRTLEKVDNSQALVPALHSQSFDHSSPLVNRRDAYNHFQRILKEINNLQNHFEKKAINITLTICSKGQILDGLRLSTYDMNKKEELKAANEEFKLYGKYKVNTENNSVTIEEGKIILKPLFFSLV